MKNIQVIDGALNSTFSIFQATDEEFALLFPEAGQDISLCGRLAAFGGSASDRGRVEPNLATSHSQARRDGNSWDIILRTAALQEVVPRKARGFRRCFRHKCGSRKLFGRN
jgi:hypothetical protein